MANLPNSGQMPMFTPPFQAAGGNRNVPTISAGQFPPRPTFQGMGDVSTGGATQPPILPQTGVNNQIPNLISFPQKGELQNSVNGLSAQSSLNVQGHISAASHQRLPIQAVGPPLGGPSPGLPFTGSVPNRLMSTSVNQGPLLNGPASNYNQLPSLSNQENRMQAQPPILGSSSYPFPQTGSRSGPPRPNFNSQNMSGHFAQPPLIGQPGMHPPSVSGSPLGRGSPDGRPPSTSEFVQKQTSLGPPKAGSATPPGSQPGRPGELPVPYHGQGQYSHQIGMQLTPGTGLTPNSSEPTSQKSSRTPSPANPVFDDMEGGITQNMTSTESRGDTPPFTPPKQKPNSQLTPLPHPPVIGGNMPRPPLMTSPPQMRMTTGITSLPQTGMVPGMTGPPQTGMAPGMTGPPQTGMSPGMTGPPQTGMAPGMTGPPQTGMVPSMTGPPQTGMAPGMTGPPQTGMVPSMTGPPQTGMAPGMTGPPQTGMSPGMTGLAQTGMSPGMTGPPQTGMVPSMTGPPQTGMAPGMTGPPQTGMVPGMTGPPQTGMVPSMTGPPQTGMAPGMTGPPQTGMVPSMTGPPQTGMAPGMTGPPQTGMVPSMTGPPQTGMAPGMTGPPQTGMSPGMTGPPQTGMSPGMTGPPQTGMAPGMTGPPQTGMSPGMTGPPQTGMSPGMTGPPQPIMTPSHMGGTTPMYRPPPPQMNVGAVSPPSQFNQPPSIQHQHIGQRAGFPPRPQYPQANTYAPTASAPWSPQENLAMSTAGQPVPTQPNITQQFPSTRYPQPPGPGQPTPFAQPNAMMPPTSGFGALSLQQDGQRMVDLLQEKTLIPSDGVETPKPKSQHDFKKVNCSPDVFRCTLNAIPQTSSLQSKARLPLGILIHPFKDLSQLPVIQSSVIVRCRSCRTYINPFVFFSDQHRWKCNLCYRVNELPDEFSFDPVSKTYGDPQRRPEIRSATIEFIAPSEYMLRPPQPAVYLFVIDVSFNAVETGYLSLLCQTMLEELDKIPGDGRTQIGFIAFDRALHFFNLAEGLSQPQMLIVSDIEDIFLPTPDNLLVNLQESKELVIDLLNQLPTLFEKNTETGSALGAAIQAAYKMTCGTGGRVSVFQTILPTVAPGALQSREEPGQKSGKNVLHLGPATDFYKKLSLDFSAQQIAVDLFLLNGQYADIASLSCVSKYSGGCVQYYPSFHTVKNPSLADKFEADVRRYLTRKIGFESVMRIRCTKGLSIHTFHGNFFVRSTDLLSLPNVNPDAGFGMQMSIEDSLTDVSQVCFQAALLYTSSKGERRIRVHTLCVPTTSELSEVYAGADQQAITSLLAKMAADRCVSSSLTDAREALINAAADAFTSYSSTLHSSQRMGSLMLSHSLRLLPLYVLALLKSTAFRLGNAKLDDRVFAMQECKSLPISQLIQSLYPALYPIHDLHKCKCATTKSDLKIPQPRLLHLSTANIDRTGAYLMDTGDSMYLYIGSCVSEQFYQDVFDSSHYNSIPEGMTELPELENELSEKLRNFISFLLDSRPFGATFLVIREDSKFRNLFFKRMVDDRSESTMSYYEFLQHLQKQVNS